MALTFDITDVRGLQPALDSKQNKSTPSSIPLASSTVVGGVKIGSGVTIAPDGTISIAKGAKGDKGDKGDMGSPGKDGVGTGSSVSVLNIVSVKDFGATPDNPDNILALEKARDYAYINQATLYFPRGDYKISRTWILRNKTTTFSTIKIIGESNPWSSRQGSNIIATFNDAPVIATQLNKGTIINGLRIVGQFQPQPYNSSFFNTPFEKWGTGARESKNSPQCGIALDAFTNVGFPPDGGYPTLQGEYNIAPQNGRGGSTGTQILNCVINNCVVAVCCSPNGSTLNNEEIIIDNFDFTNCKIGVSGGQPQEKNNILSNFASWGGTHTVFSQNVYGQGGAGNWHIEKGNLAGNVVQLINSSSTAWFPVFVSKVFAESLGKFGYMSTQMTGQVSDCHFDFQDPTFWTGYTPVVQAQGMITFSNCIFRYYNGAVPGWPIVVSGGVYEHCLFGGTPIDISQTAEYYKCIEDGYGTYVRKIGESRKNIFLTNGENIVTHNRYGDFSLNNSYDDILSFSDNATYYKIAVEKDATHVTTSGGEAFTFTSINPAAYYINGLIEYHGDTGTGWGVVSNITGNVITVKGGTPADAGFYISVIYPNHASIRFTGDITGTDEISNIKATWGIPSGGVGYVFKTLSGVFKILSYDAATNKFKTVGKLPNVQNNLTFK